MSWQTILTDPVVLILFSILVIVCVRVWWADFQQMREELGSKGMFVYPKQSKCNGCDYKETTACPGECDEQVHR